MERNIKDIKLMFETADMTKKEQLIEEYQQDTRAGVKKIIEKYEKEKENLRKERLRIEKMQEYENQYKSYKYICGIDEVGRGPLAGPVVAGAVILPKGLEILSINDSKKLSSEKRESLYHEIMEKALAVSVGIVSEKVIDQINILQATYEAMRIAIGNLSIEPTLLLNDAVIIPDISIEQVSIIKGDEKSISIAAASIIAKVTRDRIMEEYDEQYPEYGFLKNKGYGTEHHIRSLRFIGPCPIHRKSFIQNIL